MLGVGVGGPFHCSSAQQTGAHVVADNDAVEKGHKHVALEGEEVANFFLGAVGREDDGGAIQQLSLGAIAVDLHHKDLVQRLAWRVRIRACGQRVVQPRRRVKVRVGVEP